MADNETVIKKLINSLPNSISGDGSTWVAKLKKALSELRYYAEEAAKSADTKVQQVTGIQLLEFADNGIRCISVQFDSGVNEYAQAQIWVKTVGGTYQMDGVTDTDSYTFKNASPNTTYYFKVVAVNKNGVVSDFDTAPIKSITTQATITAYPPTQFIVTWDNGVPHWQWNDVSDQTDFWGYELRENTNTGAYTGLLYSGTDLESYAIPSTRSGTAYLYTRNSYGQYSQPIAKQFGKEESGQPNAPRIEAVNQGFNVVMESFPLGVLNATVEINGDEYESKGNVFHFYAVNGVFNVRYHFNDAIGAGEWSEIVTVEFDTRIDGSLIINGTVSGNKIADGAIGTTQIAAGAVTATNISSDAVTSDKIAANAIVAGKIASNAITAEKIQAGAINSDKISTDGLDANVIKSGYLDSERINAGSITGEKIAASAISSTNIAASAITADKLAANSVSADKLAANSVTAEKINITGGSSTGARIVILTNLIEVYDENNRLRVRLGVWQ